MPRRTVEYKCHLCGSDSVHTIDSRPSKLGTDVVIRRRRECKSCKHRWSTVELMEQTFRTIEGFAMLRSACERIFKFVDHDK